MYEYRSVIDMMRRGESDRRIAKSGIMCRSKVQLVRMKANALGWLQPDAAMPDNDLIIQAFSRKRSPAQTVSATKPFEDIVLAWYRQGVSTQVIYQKLIAEHGFTASYDSVRRFLLPFRDEPRKASMILSFAPGEAAQVDFGSGPALTDHVTGAQKKTWFFIMTLAFSRHQYLEFVMDQSVETWVGCHRRAFEFFGGVPCRLIIDNPKCAITKACLHDQTVQRAYRECSAGYGFLISPCPVADPQKKGIVESGVKYVKRNFLPTREFRDLADLNRQAREWVMGTAGNRKHGSTHETPLARFVELEKSALRPLPDIAPEVVTWKKCKVHGNCHVMFKKSQYSVPFSHIGETVWVSASETTVQIYNADNALIASHSLLKRPGQYTTVYDHIPPRSQAFLMQDQQYCLKEAARVGASCRHVVETLFSDIVLDRLRSVQGLLRLRKKFGPTRLELACARAIKHETETYGAVKAILAKGLDVETKPLELLDDVYRGKAMFLPQSIQLSLQ